MNKPVSYKVVIIAGAVLAVFIYNLWVGPTQASKPTCEQLLQFWADSEPSAHVTQAVSDAHREHLRQQFVAQGCTEVK